MEFTESDFSSYLLYHELMLSVPSSAREGSGVLAGRGTVSVAQPATENLTVTLSSADTSEVMVPATVTIPPGQLSVPFDLTIADDVEADGTQQVRITAVISGYGAALATVAVDDNEAASLSLSIPASAMEGAGTVSGTVSTSTAVASDLTVSLNSSDRGAVQVPVSVIIPAGQTSARFDLTIGEDNVIEPTQHVTVTASVIHWASATATIDVRDNESRNLVLAIPNSAAEGNAPVSGSVSLGGVLPNDLVISLASDDITEATERAGKGSGEYSCCFHPLRM